jgi:hypothetical protein
MFDANKLVCEDTSSGLLVKALEEHEQLKSHP